MGRGGLMAAHQQCVCCQRLQCILVTSTSTNARRTPSIDRHTAHEAGHAEGDASLPQPSQSAITTGPVISTATAT
jgi:hypothetical protein